MAMRLRRVNIKGFGKLRDFDMEFGPGLNVICSPNEGGKSTLMSFILAALYGLREPGFRLAKAEAGYEYFRPWQGPDYCGRVEYELDDGRSFEVFRDFASHRVKVFDSNGKDITTSFDIDGAKERLFAEKHTGLDKKTFRATVFIGHGSSNQLQEGEHIVSKLQSIAAAGVWAEGVPAKAAEDKLKAAEKAVGVKEGAVGTPLGMAASKVGQLEMELQNTIEKHRSVEEDLEQARLLQDQLEKLRLRREELELSAKRAKVGEIRKILGNMEEIEGCQRENAEEMRRIPPVSDAAMEAFMGLEGEFGEFLDLVAQRLQMEAAPPDLASIKELVQRDQAAAVEKSAESRTAAIRGGVAAMLGVVSLVPGIIAGSVWWWFALSAFFLLAAIAEFRGYARKRSEALDLLTEAKVREHEMAARNERVREAQEKLDNVLSRLGVADMDQLRELTASCRAMERCRKKSEELERQRSQLVADADISARRATLDGLEGELAAAVERRPELADLPMTRDQAENGIKEVDREINALSGRQNQLVGAAEVILQGSRNIGDVEADLEQAREKLEDIRKRRAAMELAIELVRVISREVHQQYARELTSLMNSDVLLITDRYREIGINENLEMNVRIPDLNEWRTVDNLSWGTKEQFFVLLKLALAQYLSRSGETLPLLLDDVFTQSDDQRMIGMSEFLANLSRSHQILLFTCHSSHADAVIAAAGRSQVSLQSHILPEPGS